MTRLGWSRVSTSTESNGRQWDIRPQAITHSVDISTAIHDTATDNHDTATDNHDTATDNHDTATIDQFHTTDW